MVAWGSERQAGEEAQGERASGDLNAKVLVQLGVLPPLWVVSGCVGLIVLGPPGCAANASVPQARARHPKLPAQRAGTSLGTVGKARAREQNQEKGGQKQGGRDGSEERSAGTLGSLRAASGNQGRTRRERVAFTERRDDVREGVRTRKDKRVGRRRRVAPDPENSESRAVG